MIKTLSIQNFILINKLEVNFKKGLNILAGETGAGKSILIDAIALAFGERASKEQIKKGTNKAIIELYLELPSNYSNDFFEQNGIDIENNQLVLSREISHSATRSRINGIMVTQNLVQELKEQLIDIHSQHETYNYIKPKSHIILLDNYGDDKHYKLIEDFTKTYNDYKNTKKEYDETVSNISLTEQRIDFLKFQIDEIEKAEIEDINEYEELNNQREILINSEELKKLTYSSYHNLYGQDGSILDAMANIENTIIKAAEFDKNLSAIADTIANSSVNLKDAADELRNYSESLETDEGKLYEFEQRIELLDKLKRKYGPTLENVLNNLETFNQELSEINITEEKIVELKQKLDDLQKTVLQFADKLSESRKILADLLSGLIQNEIEKLELPKSKFIIQVEDKELSKNGKNNVEFLISTNLGEPPKTFSKVASGGEISRVILAIKTILAQADNVNTVIFDEIDSGISGKASQAVAEEIATLSKNHQIICITHQPIIAAMADEYLYIEKIQQDEQTDIVVKNLENDEMIKELSKLAAGSLNSDKNAMNFAQKLIEQSQKYKLSV